MSDPKRGYAGWKIVKNTVLDYLDNDGVTTHTAVEIARLHDFKPASVRAAGKYLGVTIKPAPRGGRRIPCNQHTKE